CESRELQEEETLEEDEQFEFEGWIELLKTVPGIGLLSAMVFVLELGDIRRFDTAEEFSSYLGLIPGEWSSGNTQAKRSMTRWGNRRARTVLVEASWKLIGKDGRMREVYERIKAKRGSGRAICAVARRLGLAIRAMIRDQKPYQCNHPSSHREDVGHPGNCPDDPRQGVTDPKPAEPT
ncbi:MAG: transposase, partial [Bradymonadaceae bacterium]